MIMLMIIFSPTPAPIATRIGEVHEKNKIGYGVQ